jgi:hypothetical protein
MEPNAATAGLEHWCGQEVVKVYEHRTEEDEIHFHPAFLKQAAGNECREDEVKEIVNDKLKGLHYRLLVRI